MCVTAWTPLTPIAGWTAIMTPSLFEQMFNCMCDDRDTLTILRKDIQAAYGDSMESMEQFIASKGWRITSRPWRDTVVFERIA